PLWCRRRLRLSSMSTAVISPSVAHRWTPRRTTSTSGSSGMFGVFDGTETLPGSQTLRVLFGFCRGGSTFGITDDQGGAEGAVMVESVTCDVIPNIAASMFIYRNVDYSSPVFAGSHDVGVIQ